MGPITIMLGLLSAAALALSLAPRGERDHDDVVAAYGLVMVWLAGAAARSIFGGWEIGGEKAYFYVGPIGDLLFFASVVRLARWNNCRWLLILVGLSAFQLLAHVAYGLSDKSLELRDTYKLTLNVSYIAELVCVATPGGLHGVRRLLYRLRHRRAAAHPGAAR